MQVGICETEAMSQMYLYFNFIIIGIIIVN